MLSILISAACQNCEQGASNDKKNQDDNCYAQRTWCSKSKDYKYSKRFTKKEDQLSNYYKRFEEDGLTVDGVFKKKGFRVGEWFYNDKQKNLVKEETYDKEGRIKKEYIHEYYDDSTKKSITLYKHYHEKGKKSKKKLASKTNFFYKELPGINKKVKAKIENYNGPYLDEYLTFEYDPKGKLSKKSIFLFDEKRLKSYNLYIYDDKDRKTKEEIYDKKDNRLKEMLFHYNDQNQLIKREEYEFDKKSNPVLTLIKKYTYDSKGNRTEKKEFDKDKNLIEKRQYEYNSDGCKCMEKIFDGKGELIDTITSGKCE